MPVSDVGLDTVAGYDGLMLARRKWETEGGHAWNDCVPRRSKIP